MAEKLKRFNEILIKSIDATISELLSPQVLTSLRKLLYEKYGIIPDELPYRLETMYTVLDQVFGFKGARAIERRIAKHLCDEFNLQFLDTPDCTLQMYVENAKQLSKDKLSPDG